VVDQAALDAARRGRPLPSPVPDDTNLWEGEKPFTAFGQWGAGRMDKRVFSQDVWWVDVHGRPHRLEDMSTDYRRNVLAFLLGSAEQRWIGEVMREAVTAAGEADLGRVSWAVLAPGLGVPRVSEIDPVVWLESTPLMRRLRVLTPEGPAETPGVEAGR